MTNQFMRAEEVARELEVSKTYQPENKEKCPYNQDAEISQRGDAGVRMLLRMTAAVW